MSKQGIIIGVLAVLLGLVVLGASPLFVLDVTQTAIVVQLGKPVRNVTDAGLYMKDTVHRRGHLLRQTTLGLRIGRARCDYAG